MPKRIVNVRKYQRFKNGIWESVRRHEREIEDVQLSEAILKDIREGKAIRLETEAREVELITVYSSIERAQRGLNRLDDKGISAEIVKVKSGYILKEKVFFIPLGEHLIYTIGGDYQFMGLSKETEKRARSLNKLEKKAHDKGLTAEEYNEFLDLVVWDAETYERQTGVKRDVSEFTDYLMPVSADEYLERKIRFEPMIIKQEPEDMSYLMTFKEIYGDKYEMSGFSHSEEESLNWVKEKRRIGRKAYLVPVYDKVGSGYAFYAEKAFD